MSIEELEQKINDNKNTHDAIYDVSLGISSLPEDQWFKYANVGKTNAELHLTLKEGYLIDDGEKLMKWASNTVCMVNDISNPVPRKYSLYLGYNTARDLIVDFSSYEKKYGSFSKYSTPNSNIKKFRNSKFKKAGEASSARVVGENVLTKLTNTKTGECPTGKYYEPDFLVKEEK
jgi:hypothetical protein